MAEKKEYTMSDMVEHDIKTAPSLDLPALQVEKFYTPKDGGKLMVFFANVKRNWRPSDGCPCCHNHDNITLSGRREPRKIRDVVRNNYCVIIVMQTPRMTCGACGQRFNPKIDGIVENGMMTERLVEFIKTECFLQPHSTLAERTGLAISTIQSIMDVEIDRYEDMLKENPLAAPRTLGIDEKHIVNVMRGTLVDISTGNLLDMTEDNREATMKKAISKLEGWKENIKVVTTDMSNQYLSWLPSFLPEATIIIDKFHVIQDIMQRVNSVKPILYKYRKDLISRITDPTEKAEQAEVLKIVNDNKRLFNYSMDRITSDTERNLAKKIDTVMDMFPEYMLLRMFYYYIEYMYKMKTREDAEKIWDEWQEMLPPSGKKEYKAA